MENIEWLSVDIVIIIFDNPEMLIKKYGVKRNGSDVKSDEETAVSCIE